MTDGKRILGTAIWANLGGRGFSFAAATPATGKRLGNRIGRFQLIGRLLGWVQSIGVASVLLDEHCELKRDLSVSVPWTIFLLAAAQFPIGGLGSPSTGG